MSSKKTVSIFTVAALAASTLISAPAFARHDRYQQGYPDQYQGQSQYGSYGNYDQRGYDNRAYGYNGYDDRDGGYRCQKRGTTGMIIGAVAGGLLGREVVGWRGDRTAGTIVGAGVGALAGRALDRNGGRRC
jgi:Glycine zipper 2TM domain